MIQRARDMAHLIKTTRKNKMISQQKLHTLLGWSSKTSQQISNIETGKCQFPVKHLKKLSDALEIDKDTIISAYLSDAKRILEENLKC
jgi:transcriptional regulator with XRE-family HTH domain